MKIIKHEIIFKNQGVYASFPLFKYVNNNLRICFFTAPKIDHCGLFNWNEIEYLDENSRIETSALDQEYNHTVIPRLKSDIFIKNNIAIGAMAFETTGIENKDEIKDKGGNFVTIGDKLYIFSNLVFYQNLNKYLDAWEIPAAEYVFSFPRVFEKDNLILIPMYRGTSYGDKPLILRSDDYGLNWNLLNMFPDDILGNEMAFVDIDNNTIYCLIRDDEYSNLIESWSYDNGKTWTYPVFTHIKGTPPHLLKLKDGRILCSYGYRFDNMGIRAVISKRIDKSRIIWSDPFILRDDGGYQSEFSKTKKELSKDKGDMHVGYPVSIQKENGNILTAYYITCEDRITHIATTEWSV